MVKHLQDIKDSLNKTRDHSKMVEIIGDINLANITRVIDELGVDASSVINILDQGIREFEAQMRTGDAEAETDSHLRDFKSDSDELAAVEAEIRRLEAEKHGGANRPGRVSRYARAITNISGIITQAINDIISMVEGKLETSEVSRGGMMTAKQRGGFDPATIILLIVMSAMIYIFVVLPIYTFFAEEEWKHLGQQAYQRQRQQQYQQQQQWQQQQHQRQQQYQHQRQQYQRHGDHWQEEDEAVRALGVLNTRRREIMAQLTDGQRSALGNRLTSSSTESQVKKVFRRLAVHYHPDKNYGEVDPRKVEIFKEIGEAYEILKKKNGWTGGTLTC